MFKVYEINFNTEQNDLYYDEKILAESNFYNRIFEMQKSKYYLGHEFLKKEEKMEHRKDIIDVAYVYSKTQDGMQKCIMIIIKEESDVYKKWD